MPGRLGPALAMLPRIETDRGKATAGQFPQERDGSFFRPAEPGQPQGDPGITVLIVRLDPHHGNAIHLGGALK
jgi:hypothetical protein